MTNSKRMSPSVQREYERQEEMRRVQDRTYEATANLKPALSYFIKTSAQLHIGNMLVNVYVSDGGNKLNMVVHDHACWRKIGEVDLAIDYTMEVKKLQQES